MVTMRSYGILVATVLFASSAVDAVAAPDAYHDAVTADGPVLYYQLNEASGSAINYGSLGPDYNATYLGSPLRAAATSSGDSGVSFDGEDDYLESEAVAPLGLAGNPTFTAEAVVRVPINTSIYQYAPFLHWGDSSSAATMKSVYFGFHYNDPTRFYAGFYNGGLSTVDPVAVGGWYHVVWVRTGGGAANEGSIFYVNGQPVALEDDPLLGSDAATPNVVATEFRVNRAQDLVRYFIGTLDEVALYDYELDAETVMAHYTALDVCPVGTCLDADGVCKRCAHPLSMGANPTATDALAILRAAVGSRACELCVCDVNASGNIVASDALLALRRAVGGAIELICPDQEGGG
jgi:hypothetical protein